MPNSKDKKKKDDPAAKAARQRAFYTKQREDAEKASDAGDANASETARKIYAKLGNKDKAMDQANKEASNRLGPLRGAARAAGTGMDAIGKFEDVAVPLVTQIEGGKALSGLAKAGVGGAKNLMGRAGEATKGIFSRWGAGAARSGENAAAKTVTRASGRAVPKTEGKIPAKAAASSKPSKDSPGYERQAPKTANSRVGPARAQRADDAPKPERKVTTTDRTKEGRGVRTADSTSRAKTQEAIKDKPEAIPKVSNSDVKPKADAPAPAPAPKPESAPAPKPASAKPAAKPETKAPAKTETKPAAASAGEHPALTKFKSAPKGSQEKKDAWKAVPKEVQNAYKASRPAPAAKAATKADAPAKVSKGGRPKKDTTAAATPQYTDAAHEAYETGNMDKLDKKGLETYKERYTREVKRPDGSTAREVIPKSESAPASKPAKGGFVRDKIKAAKAAKTDAPFDGKPVAED